MRDADVAWPSLPERLRPLLTRLFWWAFVGGSGTMIYAVLTWIGVRVLGLPGVVASMLAFAISTAWAYLGHRSLTFRSKLPHGRSLARFGAMSLAGYALATAIPALVTNTLGAQIEVSILVTSIAVPAMNYFVMTYMVFK